MAGYSKGIVDTRKLNKDSKAKLGRGGDTKIREVDNRASHVNALEAYLIDVNGKAGEDYAKRVGAGTVNPLTGMPEYHTDPADPSHSPMTIHWDEQLGIDPNVGFDFGALDFSGFSKDVKTQENINPTYNTGEGGDNYIPYGPDEMPSGNLDYNQLTDIYGQGDLNKYLAESFGATQGKDYSMYFQDLTRGAGTADDPFDFLERGFETQKKELKLEAERAEGALGATTTRAAGGARQAARSAQSKSGFATQGSVTGQMAGQLRDIGQDFKAGQMAIGEDYSLGREKALTSYQEGVYGEERRITDRFYDMIGTLAQAGQWDPGKAFSTYGTDEWERDMLNIKVY